MQENPHSLDNKPLLNLTDLSYKERLEKLCLPSLRERSEVTWLVFRTIMKVGKKDRDLIVCDKTKNKMTCKENVEGYQEKQYST